MAEEIADTGADEPVDLLAGWQRPERIDLYREFGFIGRVSDEALAEIEANERRQARAQWDAIWWWFR